MDKLNNLLQKAAEFGFSPQNLKDLCGLEESRKKYGDTFCKNMIENGLIKKHFLTEDGKYTEETLNALNKLEDLLKPLKSRKKSVAISVDIYMVRKFRDIFPEGKLPTGSRARSNEKELIGKFQRFFKTFGEEYSWGEILNAAQMYVNRYEKDNYQYMRTAGHFIIKTMKDGSVVYDLATECDSIREGQVGEDENIGFSQKIV